MTGNPALDDGHCGPVTAGLESAGDCAVAPPCGNNGMCNGFGGCQLQPRGTLCADAVCKDEAFGNHSMVQGMGCDGKGACSGPAELDCGQYVCGAGEACLSARATDAGCSETAWCNDHHCMARLVLGSGCAAAAECLSGFCVDRVCCDRACDGQREACDAPGTGDGSKGTCAPAPAGPPRGSRPSCDKTGTTCGGQCDGEVTTQCCYPGKETECGHSCAGGRSGGAAGVLVRGQRHPRCTAIHRVRGVRVRRRSVQGHAQDRRGGGGWRRARPR